MSATCHQHSDEEEPWMCDCTRDTLEASRCMVETRDMLIKELEREIRELNAMLHGTCKEQELIPV